MCGCESSHVVKDVSVCEQIQILLVSIQLFCSSMCVQEEKKNELSNKSKQYPTNNKRFSSKVPRADWVSILNLKTRLSHVNFFIYRSERVCGWFSTCPKYRHFFYLSEKAKSSCNFQFGTRYIRLMLIYNIKTISFKRISNSFTCTCFKWYWSCMALQKG